MLWAPHPFPHNPHGYLGRLGPLGAVFTLRRPNSMTVYPCIRVSVCIRVLTFQCIYSLLCNAKTSDACTFGNWFIYTLWGWFGSEINKVGYVGYGFRVWKIFACDFQVLALMANGFPKDLLWMWLPSVQTWDFERFDGLPIKYLVCGFRLNIYRMWLPCVQTVFEVNISLHGVASFNGFRVELLGLWH